MKRATLVLVVVLAVLANATTAAASKSASVQTRAGKLEVRNGAPDAPPDSLFLKGKLVYRKENFYLGIYGVYKFASSDLVLLGVNCGGSGCTNDDLVIVSVDANGKLAFTEDKQLQSSDGAVIASQSGEKLLLDLGYENGKKKKATFQDGTLLISLERPRATPPLSKSYCEWVYDSALDGCITAKRDDPSCSDPQSTFPMVLVRGLNTVSQHPAFVAEKFSDVCRQVCATGRAPRFEPFKVGFCGIK